MPASAELRFRAACPGDAQAIAALHAGSWQRHYRGAFSGVFLDHDAAGYLLPLWTERLAARIRGRARFSPSATARSWASPALSSMGTLPGARSRTTFTSHTG